KSDPGGKGKGSEADSEDVRVSVRSKARASKDRLDEEEDSADSSVSGYRVSVAQFDLVIHSVAVPVDVERAEELIRAERLPAEGVVGRLADLPAPLADSQEEPAAVARTDRRDVLAELLAIRVTDRFEHILSPPDAEESGATAAAALVKSTG